MKAVVVKDLCIGCSLCVSTCPDVFEMEENIAVVKADPVPAASEADAKQAAKDCPTEAIKIQ